MHMQEPALVLIPRESTKGLCHWRSSRGIIPRAPYLMLLSRYHRELSIQARLRLAWHSAIIDVIKLDRIYKTGEHERVKLHRGIAVERSCTAIAANCFSKS